MSSTPKADAFREWIFDQMSKNNELCANAYEAVGKIVLAHLHYARTWEDAAEYVRGIILGLEKHLEEMDL